MRHLRRPQARVGNDRFGAPGSQCPACGWLGGGQLRRCPVDGEALEPLDDVSEAAIELALQQSAEIVRVRHLAGELEARGGIAALLRF